MVGLKVKSCNAKKKKKLGEYHISSNGRTSDYVKAEKIDGAELALL